MRFKMNRLCELAGVPGARRTRNGLLRESRYDEGDHGDQMHEEDEMPDELANALPGMSEEEEKEEGIHYEGTSEEDEKNILV